MNLLARRNSNTSSTAQSNSRKIAVTLAATIISLIGVFQYISDFSIIADTWHSITILCIRITSVFISLLTFLLVKRGKTRVAGYILIFILVVNGSATAYLYTGYGLTAQLGILIAGIVISLELLDGKSRVYGIIFTTFFGFLVYGSSFQPILWRIPDPFAVNHFTVSAITLILLSLYIIITFKNYGIRIRLLLIFLGVNLIATLLVAGVAGLLTRRALESITDRKLLFTAQNFANDVDTFIQSNIDGIQSKAASPSLAAYLNMPYYLRHGSELESEILNLISIWGRQNPFFTESIAVLDKYGNIVLDMFGEDIGKSEYQYQHFKYVIEKGLPYSSPILIFNSRNSVWYFSSPIVDSQKNIVGVLRIRYHGDLLQSLAVKYTDRIGEQSFAMLVDEYGIILAHSSEPSYVRRALLGLTETELAALRSDQRLLDIVIWANFLELRGILSKTSSTENFQTILPVENSSSVGSASAVLLKNYPWKAVIFQSNEITEVPINSQANNIILITEVAIVIIFLLGNIAIQSFTLPIVNLTNTAKALSTGDRSVRVNIKTSDEIGKLASTFNSMADQLGSTLQALENRIQDRTRALEIGAEVGRRISNILEVSRLVTEVVDLLAETLGYDHVHIYLLDEKDSMLRLAGGSGEVGQQLMKNNHQISLGRGLVGKAALQRSVVLIQDTAHDYSWLPNPLLPETRCEIAVPILIGEEVWGVIDVQKDLPNSLDDDDVYLLQLVAGQTAIAFRNASQLEAIREQADKQLTLSNFTGKIRNTTEIERALMVTIRELGRTFTGKKTVARYRIRKSDSY